MRVDVEDPDDPDMEVPFDPDDTPSHVGRLVKVRHSASEPWSHAVVCFAFTDWHLEDYHGDGVMRRVERPNGGYQLQWGMFERVELARKQKRKRSKVRRAIGGTRTGGVPPPSSLPFFSA